MDMTLLDLGIELSKIVLCSGFVYSFAYVSNIIIEANLICIIMCRLFSNTN